MNHSDSPWAVRRGGNGSNRSSPGSGAGMNGNVAGSILSLQSINGQNGSRMMEHFELIFVNEPESRFVCPACEKVMRYPVQFEECGHRCCSACLHNIVRVAARCPVDQVKIDPHNTFVDKAFQLEIENLVVKCVNVSKGCQWTGTVLDLKVHVESCDFTPVSCPKGCGLTFGRCFLVRHLVDDCPRREVTCDFCKENIAYAEEIEHMRSCNKFVVGCPNACGKKDLKRDQLDDHLNNECPKVKIQCPFVNAGCSHETLRKNLEEHLEACFEDHYEMVVQALIGLQAALTDRESLLATNVEKVSSKIGHLTAVNSDAYIWRIDNWSEVYGRAKSGRAVSINGPCVSTGTLGLGYRICPTVYPFGDGIDQGQFMSVFLSLCRTDADNLLSWPFNQRVILTLLDQCIKENAGPRHHITHVIDAATENQKAVGRPSADRGAPFGVRQFVRLEMLNVPDRFVVDNAVLLRIEID